MHDLAANDIVGDRQQRADEDAIAFLPLGEPCVAVERRIGQRLRIEAALRAGRHDEARKSVVSGNSVSVRADLGGRRLTKHTPEGPHTRDLLTTHDEYRGL